MDKKKSKYPKETLSPERNILSFKNRNPKKIKIKGKRNETPPKYLFKNSFIRMKEEPFLEKDRRKRIPTIMKPKAKIE